jgi:hypothetical protein
MSAENLGEVMHAAGAHPEMTAQLDDSSHVMPKYQTR